MCTHIPPYVFVCVRLLVFVWHKLRCSGLGRSLKRRLRKSTDLIDEITTAVETTLTPVSQIFTKDENQKLSWSQARVSAASCPLFDRLPCGPGAHHARSAELECSPICCPNSGGIGAPLQATSAVVAHHTLQSTDVGNRAQSYLHRLKFVGNSQ